MTAPTEAEIREAINTNFGEWDDLASAINAVGNVLDALYDTEEFRQSELDALDAIGSAEKSASFARVKAEMTEVMVRGALQFAADHPDAPRAAREPVTA